MAHIFSYAVMDNNLLSLTIIFSRLKFLGARAIGPLNLDRHGFWEPWALGPRPNCFDILSVRYRQGKDCQTRSVGVLQILWARSVPFYEWLLVRESRPR